MVATSMDLEMNDIIEAAVTCHILSTGILYQYET